MWHLHGHAALALGFLFACSGNDSEETESSSSNGPAPGGPVARGQFADQLALALCGNLEGCCREAGLGYDRGVCETTLGQVYGALLETETSAADYDAALAGECLDQVGASVAACNFSNFGGEACRDVFSSTAARGALGDPCGKSCEETTSGTSCWIEGDDPGECYREDGLYCDVESFSCGPQVENGGACVSSQACDRGYCDGDTCARPLAEGGYCGFDDLACMEGLLCDIATGQCAAKASQGESCFVDDECASLYCLPEGVCGDPSEGTGDDLALLNLACGE